MGLFAFRENYVRTFEKSLVVPKHETRKPGFGEEPLLEMPQSVQPKPGNGEPKPRKTRAPKAQPKAEISPAQEVSNDADV